MCTSTIDDPSDHPPTHLLPVGRPRLVAPPGTRGSEGQRTGARTGSHGVLLGLGLDLGRLRLVLGLLDRHLLLNNVVVDLFRTLDAEQRVHVESNAQLDLGGLDRSNALSKCQKDKIKTSRF